MMKRWREILTAEQEKKRHSFTHFDSFFPRATHCALLAHAWGEIFNIQPLTGMCADMHRQISLPNSSTAGKHTDFFFFFFKAAVNEMRFFVTLFLSLALSSQVRSARLFRSVHFKPGKLYEFTK